MNTCFTISELPDLVPKILTTLAQYQVPETATVVCLHGDLGAGKTTLTKQIGAQLGITANIQSPTFTILKKYSLPEPSITPWKYLIHIDAYRLHHESELIKLDWETYVSHRENIIFVEWASHIPTCIPKNHIDIYLEHVSETTRMITIKTT